MTRILLIIALATWNLLGSHAYSADHDRPNVLLIVTDDQGYGDIASHGNPLLRTPNLDRLRASSIRLEDYHVDPACTPTRAALLTGRYCGRTRAWNVIHGRQLLHPREVTMADVFRDSGYATAMFGKWHLGDPWPYNPGNRGFQEVVCHRAGGVDELGNPLGNDYVDDIYYHNETPEQYQGYCTDVFVGEAIRFIRKSSIEENAKPFFVYLPTNAMHSPFNVPEQYAKRFREQGLPENRARFYGMIENFDANLGRLTSALDELGKAENTILIFMGDNGTAANSGSEGAYNAGMRGHKGSTFEGGHRVACFIRWPAKLSKGRAIKQLTCHRDWLPTLIELCGLNHPEGVEFDGRSIAPLLLDQKTDWPDRTMLIERQGTQPAMALGPKSRVPYAVLTEKWRLVGGQLFDIKADPGQTTDVAAEYPKVVETLKSRYRQYYDDVYADVSDEACFVVGAPQALTTEFTARDWRPTKGGVVWELKQLDRDDLYTQGYWPLQVVETGNYRIDLGRYPFGQSRPMKADHARLQIGDTTRNVDLSSDATLASFTVSLSAGKTRLHGELRDESSQKIRGPFFVRVTKTED